MVTKEFAMIPQLLVIGPKPFDIITYFVLQPGKTNPDLHTLTLHYRSKVIMMKDKNGQVNALTRAYICALYNLTYLQWYTANYKIEYKDT